MKQSLNRLRVGMVAASIAFIILGSVLIMWPETSLQLIVYIVGALVLIMGIMRMIGYIKADSEYRNFLQVIESIVFVAMGLMMIFYKAEVINLITYIFGFYIVIDGLINIMEAFQLKSIDFSQWKVVVWIGIITAVIGGVFLLKPLSSRDAIAIFMGALLIYDGLVNLYVAYCAHKVTKYFDSEMKRVKNDIIDVEAIEENEDE